MMMLKDKIDYLSDRIAELKAENEELVRSNRILSDQLQEAMDGIEHYRQVAAMAVRFALEVCDEVNGRK